MTTAPEARALADILRREIDERHALLLQVALDARREVRALVRTDKERTR
jgi:hypothetical protein